MASTAISGSLLAVLTGTDKILESKSCTLTVNVAMAPSSTKDGGRWASHIKGERDWVITIDGLVDETNVATGFTHHKMMAMIIDGTADTVMKFVTNSPTNTVGWTGEGTFANLTTTGPQDEASTWSVEIIGNSPLTELT
ncbi:MAG TPA: hypothetical protein VMV77_04515 [Bacteroidales bacterium]|nr:hypothetical protein [Bacteroidales bacterium]